MPCAPVSGQQQVPAAGDDTLSYRGRARSESSVPDSDDAADVDGLRQKAREVLRLRRAAAREHTSRAARASLPHVFQDMPSPSSELRFVAVKRKSYVLQSLSSYVAPPDTVQPEEEALPIDSSAASAIPGVRKRFTVVRPLRFLRIKSASVPRNLGVKVCFAATSHRFLALLSDR